MTQVASKLRNSVSRTTIQANSQLTHVNHQEFYLSHNIIMLPTTNTFKKLAPRSVKGSLELLKINNLAIRTLTSQYKDEVLHLMAKQFSSKEPISQAIYKLQPKMRMKAYENQHKLWSVYIDQCIESGISVVIVDLQKNSQVIGVTVVKDYNLQKQQYQREILVEDNVMLPTEIVGKKMLNSVDFHKSHIFQKEGNVADLWGGAIKESYTGKGLFKHMITSSCFLAKQAGYQHAFAFSTNFKTATSFKNLGFSNLTQMNIKDLKLNGVKLFKQIDNLHSTPSIWMKCLD